jgi:hypothetical protein
MADAEAGESEPTASASLRLPICNAAIICCLSQLFTKQAQQVAEKRMSLGPFGTRVGPGQQLVTSGQAMDILANGAQAPISDWEALQPIRYAIAILSPFYPSIDFSVDEREVIPNLYAFEEFGVNRVVFGGGLARMKCFGYEGQFLALAYGAACFEAREPKNAAGYSAVTQADAHAFGVIARRIWSNDYPACVTSAIAQWEALFALVSADHAAGDPKDPFGAPSLSCRIEAAAAAAHARPSRLAETPQSWTWLRTLLPLRETGHRLKRARRTMIDWIRT